MTPPSASWISTAQGLPHSPPYTRASEHVSERLSAQNLPQDSDMAPRHSGSHHAHHGHAHLLLLLLDICRLLLKMRLSQCCACCCAGAASGGGGHTS